MLCVLLLLLLFSFPSLLLLFMAITYTQRVRMATHKGRRYDWQSSRTRVRKRERREARATLTAHCDYFAVPGREEEAGGRGDTTRAWRIHKNCILTIAKRTATTNFCMSRIKFVRAPGREFFPLFPLPFLSSQRFLFFFW